MDPHPGPDRCCQDYQAGLEAGLLRDWDCHSHSETVSDCLSRSASRRSSGDPLQEFHPGDRRASASFPVGEGVA